MMFALIALANLKDVVTDLSSTELATATSLKVEIHEVPSRSSITVSSRALLMYCTWKGYMNEGELLHIHEEERRFSPMAERR